MNWFALPELVREKVRDECDWHTVAMLDVALGKHVDLDAYHMNSAASQGHINVIKWLRANNCPWSQYTCAHAAEHGHLDVLQWLRANGCPWDVWVCTYAAARGHLDMLKWAVAHGCDWSYRAYVLAKAGNHQHVVAWFQSQWSELWT